MGVGDLTPYLPILYIRCFYENLLYYRRRYASSAASRTRISEYRVVRTEGLEPPTHGLNPVALPIEPCPHMGGRFPSLIAYSPAYCQRVLPFSWVLTTRPAFARLDSRGATFWVFRPSHSGQFLIRSVVVISRVGFCSI